MARVLATLGSGTSWRNNRGKPSALTAATSRETRWPSTSTAPSRGTAPDFTSWRKVSEWSSTSPRTAWAKSARVHAGRRIRHDLKASAHLRGFSGNVLAAQDVASKNGAHRSPSDGPGLLHLGQPRSWSAPVEDALISAYSARLRHKRILDRPPKQLPGGRPSTHVSDPTELRSRGRVTRRLQA